MGKERLVEPAKRGLKSAFDFAKKPEITLFTGGALSVSGLGLSAVDGNGTAAVLNTIGLTINVGVAYALSLKNSKSDRRQSNSPE